MAMKAVLTVSGKDYKVFEYEIEFNQQTGKDGRPTASVLNQSMYLTIEGTDDTTVVAWMLSETKHLDGEINFYSADDGEQVLRKISFEKGWGASYILKFGDNQGLMEEIQVMPEKVTIGSVEFQQT